MLRKLIIVGIILAGLAMPSPADARIPESIVSIRAAVDDYGDRLAAVNDSWEYVDWYEVRGDWRVLKATLVMVDHKATETQCYFDKRKPCRTHYVDLEWQVEVTAVRCAKDVYAVTSSLGGSECSEDPMTLAKHWNHW